LVYCMIGNSAIYFYLSLFYFFYFSSLSIETYLYLFSFSCLSGIGYSTIRCNFRYFVWMMNRQGFSTFCAGLETLYSDLSSVLGHLLFLFPFLICSPHPLLSHSPSPFTFSIRLPAYAFLVELT
jgi:hypothetical protein